MWGIDRINEESRNSQRETCHAATVSVSSGTRNAVGAKSWGITTYGTTETLFLQYIEFFLSLCLRYWKKNEHELMRSGLIDCR
jgi:hypothetical protein